MNLFLFIESQRIKAIGYRLTLIQMECNNIYSVLSLLPMYYGDKQTYFGIEIQIFFQLYQTTKNGPSILVIQLSITTIDHVSSLKHI